MARGEGARAAKAARGSGGGGRSGAGEARRGGQPSLPGEEELAAIGAGRVAPAYLVHGADRLLHEEIEAALRQAVLAPGWEDLNCQVWEGRQASLEQLVQSARVPPWGTGGRLLVVRGAAALLGEEASGGGRRRHAQRVAAKEGDAVPVPSTSAAPASAAGPLLAYLAVPCPTTCLLFSSDEELDAQHPLVRAVAAAGRVVTARPLDRQALQAWVMRAAERLGKRMDPAAAACLVERCQEERVLLRSELEKLACYAGERVAITRDDVLAVVPKSREESIFEILDAVAERDAGRALLLLEEVLGRGEPPLGVLGLLARNVRLACHARDLAQAGRSADEVARLLGQRPWTVRRLLRQGGVIGEAVPAAFAALLEADLAIKNGSQQPEVALAALCVKLSLAGRSEGIR